MPDRTRMHMTMIGDLTHHVVDNEVTIAILLARNHRERLDHEGLLFFGGISAMIAEHRHWGIAGIAVENRKLEWGFELAMPGSVMLQFAEIAFRHRATSLGHGFEKPRTHCAYGAFPIRRFLLMAS